jgi:pimeloyl-ACP methyl ester carboxylesterase
MESVMDRSDSSGHYFVNAVVKFAWRMGTLGVGLGGIIATFLYFKQDSLLYFPEIGGIPRRPGDNPRRYRSPAEHHITFESLKIECEDGVSIHSWLLLQKENAKSAPTIIFFHGNAGNIGLRLPNAKQMMKNLNANVMMVEYRGYGDSDTVKPNEAGLKLDAQAALRFIVKHPKIDPSKIIIFGRSLGGSVAFHLAQYAQQNNLPVAGVVVENTFLSISSMVDHLMPYVAPFKPLVLRLDWNSENIVPRLEMPVFYIGGAQDQLVPHPHMLKLYKKTTRSRLVRLHVVPDGTHNETWVQGGQEYWVAFAHFLMQAMHTTGTCGLDMDTDLGLDQPTPVKSSSYETPEIPNGSSSSSSAASAIPIMPSRILGMARESMSMRDSSDSAVTPGKKEM